MSDEMLTWAEIPNALPTLGRRDDGALLKLDYGIARLWWRPDTGHLMTSNLGLGGWEDSEWTPPEDFPTPDKRGHRFTRSEVDEMPEQTRAYRTAIAHQILNGEEVAGLRQYRERLANEVLMSGRHDED